MPLSTREIMSKRVEDLTRLIPSEVSTLDQRISSEEKDEAEIR